MTEDGAFLSFLNKAQLLRIRTPEWTAALILEKLKRYTVAIEQEYR